MKVFFILFLLLPYAVLPYAALAQQKAEPNLIQKLEGREAVLENKIENEVDPEKRKKYLRMFYHTQEYYLTDKARMEIVRQTNPEFVKQVEYYRQLPADVKEKRLEASIQNQMSKSSEIISDGEKKWEDSSENQRVKACNESSNLCLEEGKLDECKFVLLRCKFIIDDRIYSQVKEYVKSRASASVN